MKLAERLVALALLIIETRNDYVRFHGRFILYNDSWN